MEVIISEKFKTLMPPLSEEEYKNLEDSIVSEGCRDPLVLWNNTLVDGHNRYEICQKHGIEFKTIQMEFDSEEDVEFWIIKNQLSRRNIGPGTRIILAKKLEPWLREKARENQSTAGKEYGRGIENGEEIGSVNIDKSYSKDSSKPIDVRREIADAARVSVGTLSSFNQVQSKRPDLAEKILSNEMKIGKAHRIMKEDEARQKQLIAEKDSEVVNNRNDSAKKLWTTLIKSGTEISKLPTIEKELGITVSEMVAELSLPEVEELHRNINSWVSILSNIEHQL